MENILRDAGYNVNVDFNGIETRPFIVFYSDTLDTKINHRLVSWNFVIDPVFRALPLSRFKALDYRIQQQIGDGR